jgi:hypothetical protein
VLPLSFSLFLLSKWGEKNIFHTSSHTALIFRIWKNRIMQSDLGRGKDFFFFYITTSRPALGLSISTGYLGIKKPEQGTHHSHPSRHRGTITFLSLV